MRVALVADPFVPVPPLRYGGTEQVIFYLARGLKEAGHTPIVFGPGGSNPGCRLIETTPEPLGFSTDPKEAWKKDKEFQQIKKKTIKLIRDNLSDFDIIHSHGLDMSFFSEFPNVTTIHNPLTFSNFDFYKERPHLNYVTVGKNMQGVLPGMNCMAYIHNGEDPKEFPIVEKPQNYACFLGRFDADKNPRAAIELAIYNNIPIRLAGKIDHRGNSYFKESIKPLLEHPLVEYVGELDFKGKVELLSNARINLHPVRFREPFGLTVIEAAFCGTPTLANDRGEMKELLRGNKIGVLVQDFNEGAHHFKECLEMPREDIAKYARKRFNHMTMTKKYVKIYKQVIKEHNATTKTKRQRSTRTSSPPKR